MKWPEALWSLRELQYRYHPMESFLRTPENRDEFIKSSGQADMTCTINSKRRCAYEIGLGTQGLVCGGVATSRCDECGVALCGDHEIRCENCSAVTCMNCEHACNVNFEGQLLIAA